MSIQIRGDDHHRVVYDDMNPRNYSEEFKCAACGEWRNHEEVNWVRPQGTLSVDEGEPYCDGCLPQEVPDFDKCMKIKD